MARDDDRLTHALELLEDLAHLDPRTRIKAGGRLIEEQNGGVVHERARQAHALFQSAGERVYKLVLAVGHADKRKQIVDDLLTPRLRLSVAGRIEVEVLGDRQLVVYTEEIRHVSDSGVDLLALFHDVSTADVGLAFGRLEESGEDAKRRRLARAVRSHETEDLALGHLEGDVVEGRAIPIDLGESLDRDHWTPPVSDRNVVEKVPSELSLSRTSPLVGLTAPSGIDVAVLSW